MCAGKFLWPDRMFRTNMPQCAMSAPRKEIPIYPSSTYWRVSFATVSLASLSTSSLNRFTNMVSKAEALSAEIACIHTGLPADTPITIDPKPSLVRKKPKGKHCGMTRFNTPISI